VYVSPLLFFVVAAFLPVYLVLFRWFTGRIRTGSETVRQRLDCVFGRLKEKIDGMLVVKAHAREDAEIAEFSAQIEAAHEPRVQVGRMGAAFSNLTLATSAVGGVVVFTVGAFEVLGGRMTPGQLISATSLAALLFGPVSRLADLASVFQQARTSLARLKEILNQPVDVPEPEQQVPLVRARGEVVFDRVTFGYLPGQKAIREVSLKIEPGMKVALVGPTGCGKTTLVNLLLRFYDPQEGQIRLDGIPLPHLGVADLRRQVGVVPQETILFRESLADNIRYGSPQADALRVQAAAEAALVHDFARRLPQGYDTIIGEGGHKLSQGERQRIAIARAFCKDPSLIVLDEATSSLDTASEALIQAALANLLRGRTAFIIAHRLSTVLDADLIVVLEAGRVVQTGTHAELLAEANGLYRRLIARQMPELLAVPASGTAPGADAPGSPGALPTPRRVPVVV
jgi:subfamily B ATP-binding cassette protein MsbA